MRIVFLATSAADLAWFRTYYRKVFPEGASRAKAQYRKTMTLLSSNLFIGHPIAASANIQSRGRRSL